MRFKKKRSKIMPQAEQNMSAGRILSTVHTSDSPVLGFLLYLAVFSVENVSDILNGIIWTIFHLWLIFSHDLKFWCFVSSNIDNNSKYFFSLLCIVFLIFFPFNSFQFSSYFNSRFYIRQGNYCQYDTFSIHTHILLIPWTDHNLVSDHNALTKEQKNGWINQPIGNRFSSLHSWVSMIVCLWLQPFAFVVLELSYSAWVHQ